MQKVAFIFQAMESLTNCAYLLDRLEKEITLGNKVTPLSEVTLLLKIAIEQTEYGTELVEYVKQRDVNHALLQANPIMVINDHIMSKKKK